MPGKISDPAWAGIADPESASRCRMNGLLPEKVVAYEGTNTGHLLYACLKHAVLYYFDLVA
jgi:hypothetical protein